MTVSLMLRCLARPGHTDISLLPQLRTIMGNLRITSLSTAISSQTTTLGSRITNSRHTLMLLLLSPRTRHSKGTTLRLSPIRDHPPKAVGACIPPFHLLPLTLHSKHQPHRTPHITSSSLCSSISTPLPRSRRRQPQALDLSSTLLLPNQRFSTTVTLTVSSQLMITKALNRAVRMALPPTTYRHSMGRPAIHTKAQATLPLRHRSPTRVESPRPLPPMAPRLRLHTKQGWAAKLQISPAPMAMQSRGWPVVGKAGTMLGTLPLCLPLSLARLTRMPMAGIRRSGRKQTSLLSSNCN